MLPHILEGLQHTPRLPALDLTFLVLFHKAALTGWMSGSATAPSSVSASVLMKRSLSHRLTIVMSLPTLSSYFPHVAFTCIALLSWLGG